MENQFSFEDSVNFDFKLLWFKLLSHWKWFVLTLIIGLLTAYYVNLRKENIYELDNYITIKDESNPFFTSNMSLVFNWGGVSDKVNLVVTTLQSRSHNEKVVKKLKSYIQYRQKGPYFKLNLYQKSPFIFEPDSTSLQVIDQPVQIQIIDDGHFKLIFHPKHDRVQLYDYLKQKSVIKKTSDFEGIFSFNQPVKLAFLNGVFKRHKNVNYEVNKTYYLILRDFNKVVTDYRNRLKVKTKNKNSSILVLKMRGSNKAELADYLNTTTQLLQKQILEDKNKFALNTIKFIDSTLQHIQTDLSLAAQDLKKFVKNKTVLNLDDPTARLFEQVSVLDQNRSQISLKKLYYQRLQKYLKNKTNYENLPAPSVVGIDDPTIVEKIAKITQLAIQRKNALAHFQPNSPVIKKLNLEIESLRQSLLQTVQFALQSLDNELKIFNDKIALIENKINKLPEEKQILLGLKRKYELKQEVYNTLLQKRNEAGIVKASNVSDLKIIDNAKDIGQGPVAPNRRINYLIALVVAFLLPALIIATLFFLDNKIHDISDVENLTDLPIIGQIFHLDKKEFLPVIQYKDDIVSESFRTLRSALRFMLPPNKKSHTLLITSSISGEGKTFISSNLAIVQAIANKKTVVLEFDLRKPKFKEYFKEAENNRLGLSNFLSGMITTVDEIIVPTDIDNLDLILVGPIPPNPSELILSDNTQKLFEQLSQKYDYIIIDTPPMGLVSDALELQKFADMVIFIVREDYTLKSYIKDIDERKKALKNLGIIYNDLKVNAVKKYAYGNNYEYGYGPYFEKKPGLWKKIKQKLKAVKRKFS